MNLLPQGENGVVSATNEDAEKKNQSSTVTAATTTAAATAKSRGVIVPVKDMTRQPIVDKQIKKKPAAATSTSISTSTISNNVTDTRHHNNSKNSTESNGNGRSGTDALCLHYIILDGLTSSWREFLAIHEMPRKVLLTPHILSGVTKDIPDDGATPTGRGSSRDSNIW